MRNLIVLFVLLTVINSTVFTQTSKPIAKENADFKKLSFEVELNKKSYLPLEPLFVKFKVTNQTEMPLAATRPRFLLDSTLKLTNFRGEVKEITNLSLTSGGGLSLPGTIPILQHLQSYEEETIPAINPDVFTESGKYQLQFVLATPDGGTKSIKSNVVEIIIEEPSGINKEAFDFLNKNGKDVWFGTVFVEENGVDLLETFVGRYSESVYGEYAIVSLGNYYRSKGEFDKAQNEFEKAKSSNNKYIADNVNKSLADITQKKIALEKKEKP